MDEPDIDYSGYADAAARAAVGDEAFSKFKQDWHYAGSMLEQFHPGVEFLGYTACEWLTKTVQHMLPKLPWDKYRLNDTLGNPKLNEWAILRAHGVPGECTFSHTTLRYVVTSLNILLTIGEKLDKLDTLRIVEVGGAYGGLCAILMWTLRHLKPGIQIDYTIIDLEGPRALQSRYLTALGLDGVTCSSSTDYNKGQTYDLFLSTYTLGEIPRAAQDEYIRDLVMRSRHGYIVWNRSEVHPTLRALNGLREGPEAPAINNGTVRTLVY
jgi:hypothetical protein